MQIDYTKIWYQGCKGVIKGTEPQKYAELQKMEDSGDYFAQPKCDGIWSIIFGDALMLPSQKIDEFNKTFSRTTEEKNKYKLPFVGFKTAIVGELGYGSQHSNRRRKRLGYNFIDVFEILFYKGKYVGDLPEKDRRAVLREWHSTLPADDQKHFKVLPLWFSRFVKRYKKQPEGLILKKRFNGGYTPDSKIKDWIKCKKEYDWDMVLMDFELSTATTKVGEPMVKNLIFGQYVNGLLQEMTKVGALDNDMSRKIAQNFSKYKGKIAVVHGYQQFESGGIRHPSFGGFRDDKFAKDCIFVPDI